MLIVSKVSPEIEIEHLDEGRGPDRFVISEGGFKYTLIASEPCLTSGDLDTIERAPRPTFQSNDCVAQIVNIHDEFAAKASGSVYGPSRMVRLFILETLGDGAVAVGGYHDFKTFGSSDPLTPANDAEPLFVGTFVDVTEEFVWSADAEQLQARLDVGRVYQRLCVDTDQARSWHPDLPPGIVFCGTHAPALDTMNARERTGLLSEAGFSSLQAFAATQFASYPQTREWARALTTDDVHVLPVPDTQTLHCHRLHTDEIVQDECYGEIACAAVEAFAAVDCPEPIPSHSMTPLMSAFGV